MSTLSCSQEVAAVWRRSYSRCPWAVAAQSRARLKLPLFSAYCAEYWPSQVLMCRRRAYGADSCSSVTTAAPVRSLCSCPARRSGQPGYAAADSSARSASKSALVSVVIVNVCARARTASSFETIDESVRIRKEASFVQHLRRDTTVLLDERHRTLLRSESRKHIVVEQVPAAYHPRAFRNSPI